ncbi:MAG: TaqI family restriction endonuclease [Candidatus Pacearchaeota archaeon]
MLVQKFDKFLQSVDLKSYRDKYRPVKIVEMDMPKEVQAINMLYKVYWDQKKFLSFEDFYKEYLNSQKTEIESFRKRTTICEDCFYRGLPARIYRTWASIITQIHAGYVAESVYGDGTVAMSAELDHQGADFQVKYRGVILNYQVKKTSYSGVKSGKPLPRKKKLKGEAIDIKYEVPAFLSEPKTKDGKFRKPYLRFLEDKRVKALKNGFVVFTSYAFVDKKKEIDEKLK